MPYNLHSFAYAVRHRALAAMQADTPVKIVYHDTRRPATQPGLYIDSPTPWELGAAVERAVAEGFEVIYITVKGDVA